MKLTFRKREQPEQTCVYCRDASAEALTPCPGCGATFHDACREELGRCSTIGCAHGADAAWRAQHPEVDWREQHIDHSTLSDQPGRSWLSPKVQDGVTHDPIGLAQILGVSMGLLALVLGFLIGGGFVSRHVSLHLPSALKYSLLGIPAGLAGAAYGFLQGLIGVRRPQPDHGGYLSALLAITAAAVGFKFLGWWGLSVGIPMLMLGGRWFGFDMGGPDES